MPDPQVPEGPAELGGWLTRNVLRPSSATDAAFGLFSATGFTDELTAEADASKGKVLLASLNDLYGQPS